ncbi:BQ2448_1458 [Microbotryum intermedium]|uniref:BQ2448_1458 protein n=1 Tax=Microbotryum intermedium TaxID=269621 RepID=A0A238FDV4_9BASI|nr:BQ2448_1458 [Microbotryum intermedium]
MSIAPDHTDSSVTDPSSLISPFVEKDAQATVRTGVHVSWLSILGIPLVFFPRILSIVFAKALTTNTLTDEVETEVIRQLNPLERSMAGLAGTTLLALASLLLVQTGSLPLTSSLSASASVVESNSLAPFRSPTIFIGVLFFSAIAYESYYGLGMYLVAGPSAGLGLWGVWALLFAHEGRVNRVGGSNKDPRSGMKKKMDSKNL